MPDRRLNDGRIVCLHAFKLILVFLDFIGQCRIALLCGAPGFRFVRSGLRIEITHPDQFLNGIL